MNILFCLVLSVILFSVILFICKWFNFSIIPREMQLPPPKKFNWPRIKRNGYNWTEDIDDFDYSSEEYSSDEE